MTSGRSVQEGKNKADGWVTAIVLLSFGAFLAFKALQSDGGIDWGFLNDRVTDYQIYCSGEMQGSECKGNWYQGSAETYTVLKDQQLVIAQSADGAPMRLKDCAVIDRTNWRCKTDGQYQLEVGYNHGEFFSQWLGEMSVMNGGYQSPKHVSRLQWTNTPKAPASK